jgi:hypothetical protein
MYKKNDSVNIVAFLVVSCDSYSDVWDIFFKHLSKYWPDCPYDVFLQSNFKEFHSDKGVKTLKVGKDKSWSDGLIKALSQLQKYEYVLLALEDLIIKDFVNNEAVNAAVENMIEINANYLTLVNEPKPDKGINSFFGEISPGAMYRSTATFALWNKNTLIKVLDREENAWEFEKIGSQRSKSYPGFYAVYTDYFPYINAVIKGKWTYEAMRYFEKNNIPFNVTRDKMSLFDWYKHRIHRVLRRMILTLTPFKLRRKLLRNK